MCVIYPLSFILLFILSSPQRDHPEMGAKKSKVNVQQAGLVATFPIELDPKKVFPPSGNFEWLTKEYKQLLEDYLALVLGPWQTHEDSYNRQLLRAGMVCLIEIFYGSGEERAFVSETSTEYRDEQALKTSCLPHLQTCARALGLNDEEHRLFHENFDVFCKVVVERQDAINSNKVPAGKLPAMQDDENEAFVGSVGNLLFGRIVGDALGLHPVFGAMLNPTGGIVGPGNSTGFMRCVGTAPGLNRHALGHDAFGYLLNFHQRGPGYCYLELNAVGCCGCGKRLVRTDPIGGQHTGFYWWIKYVYGSCAAACTCCLCLPWVLHRSYPNRRPTKDRKSVLMKYETNSSVSTPFQHHEKGPHESMR
jgi:hypothetical protein